VGPHENPANLVVLVAEMYATGIEAIFPGERTPRPSSASRPGSRRANWTSATPADARGVSVV